MPTSASFAFELLPAIHGRAHEFYRLGKPLEHRLADQKVPDIELDDLRQCRDHLGAGVIETVAGMHFETQFMREFCSGANALPFRFGCVTLIFAESVAPGADMNFIYRRP